MIKNVKKPMLGAAYYPEAWPEDQIAPDIAAMVEAGITVVRIGEFAWSKMEPREGEFRFGWLHRVISALAEAGIAVILGTPSATPPIWLEELDPEMRLLDDVGLRHDHGGRRHCCSNNPTYVKYSLRIAERMAREFGQHPNVIGWQIDNEIAAFDHGCFCPHCIEAFKAHLQERYGTIEALNRRWNLNLFSQEYASFDQIPQPKPHTWHSPHLKFEWATFHAQSHIRFIHAQADILHQYTEVPVGTDMMPVFNQDYGKMNAFLDVVQYNHYDDEGSLWRELFWFDFMRGIKNRPFWVTETATCWNGSTSTPSNFRAEGFCQANSWLPITLGAEANMYWLWRQHWAGHELMHGAVLYASGRPMHIFGEVQKIAAGFEKCAAFLSGTKVETRVAMMASTTCDYLMKQQEVVWEPDSHQWETAYTKRLYMMHRPMSEMGIRPDVIPPEKDLGRYRLLLTPFLLTMEEENLHSRVREWVEQGGTWIAGPICDIRDNIGAHYIDRETGLIEEITGSRLSYQIPDSYHHFKLNWSDGAELKAERWLQLFDVDGDTEVLASLTSGYSALEGKTVIFRKQVGKGNVIVLGTIPSPEDCKKLMEYALAVSHADRLHIQGTVAAARRTGGSFRGITATEYGGNEGAVILDGEYIDLLTDTIHSDQITLSPWQTVILERIEEDTV